jgi:hypothetical protein
MDSSDIMARRKAMVIYTDMLAKFKAANPSGDCQALCNCTSVSCTKIHFRSYALKYVFTNGGQLCPCAPN